MVIMSKYKVYFYYEEQGYAIVEANNEEQAQELMQDTLAEDGIDFSFNIKERCFGTEAIEKMPDTAELAMELL
jgi:hypothetical protein